MERDYHVLKILRGPVVSFEERSLLLGEGWTEIPNDRYRIIFPTENSVRFRMDDLEFSEPLEPGDMLVLPCPCVEGYARTDKRPEQTCLAYVFDCDRDMCLSRETALSEAPPPVDKPHTLFSLRGLLALTFPRVAHFKGVAKGDSDIAHQLNQLAVEADLDDIDSRLRAGALMSEIFVALRRRFRSPSESPETAPPGLRKSELVVRNARLYLHKHYNRNVSLERVAAFQNISAEHLARLFKRETGHTVFQELARIRMARAERLLATTGYGVVDIAKFVGFQSSNAFHHSFRRHADCTPSQYRMKVSERAIFHEEARKKKRRDTGNKLIP